MKRHGWNDTQRIAQARAEIADGLGVLARRDAELRPMYGAFVSARSTADTFEALACVVMRLAEPPVTTGPNNWSV